MDCRPVQLLHGVVLVKLVEMFQNVGLFYGRFAT